MKRVFSLFGGVIRLMSSVISLLRSFIVVLSLFFSKFNDFYVVGFVLDDWFYMLY